jgi:nickel/cobalt exporter
MPVTDAAPASRRVPACTPTLPIPAAAGSGARTPRRLAVLALAALAILVVDGMLASLLAQSPFGGPRPPAAPPPPADGVVGWIFAKQKEFYRQFSGLIRAARADGSAVWALLGVSFLYGVFHAAGPGHGKAVISSYVIANDETWRRGVLLSFASALLQALVAVAIVGVAAALLNATAQAMRRTTDVIEIVSYLLIIWIGGRLLLVKGWAFIRELFKRPRGAMEAPVLALLLTIVDVAFLQIGAFIAYGMARSPAGFGIAEVGYLLVIAFCLWLLWAKTRRLVDAWSKLRSARALGAAVTPADHHAQHDHAQHAHGQHAHHGHDHGHHAHDRGHHDHAQHAHTDHTHDDHAHHDHAHSDHHAPAALEHHAAHDRGHAHHAHGHDHAHHDHDHHDASAWSHAHAPEPEQLAGPGGWKRGLSAIVAVGIRPCSGAIIVLVFALAQGLFWAGVAATFVMGLGTAITVAIIATVAVAAKSWAGRFASLHSGFGMVAMRGIEVCAALLIIAFGTLMLAGYMFSERMI